MWLSYAQPALHSSQSVVIRINPDSTSEDLAMFARAIDELDSTCDDDDDQHEEPFPCFGVGRSVDDPCLVSARQIEEPAEQCLKYVDALEKKVARALESKRNRELSAVHDSESSFWCSSESLSSPSRSSVGSHSSHDDWASDGSPVSAHVASGLFSTMMCSHLEGLLEDHHREMDLIEASSLPGAKSPRESSRGWTREGVHACEADCEGVHDGEADRDVEVTS